MNVVRISDGLGNQMFQYAFARKMQIMTRKKVCLDIRFINNEDMFRVGKMQTLKGKLEYRKYGINNFRIKLPVANDATLSRWNYLKQDKFINRYICELAKRKLWFCCWLDEEVSLPKRFITIKNSILPTYYQGYFFDLKYYEDIKNVLQQEFKLRKPMVLPKKLRNIMLKENTVSVHIRRGDFLKLNRDISQSNYYSKAFELIDTKVENPVYLVFSDDIEWVKTEMDIPGDKVYVSEMGFEDYEELTIMKHCKYNIIANSTFSYWAAYLNENEDKIVICPKRWKTAIIPKCWIGI